MTDSLAMRLEFSLKERTWLWLIAIAGLTGPNGVFLFYALFRTDVLVSALQNPVGLVFIIDALVAMLILAFLFNKSKVSRLQWGWFIVLSLLGGLVFSIPAFLLLRPNDLGVESRFSREE